MLRIKIRDCTSNDFHTLPPETRCISRGWAVQYGWVEADDDWMVDTDPRIQEQIRELREFNPGDEVFVLSDDIDERTDALKYWRSEVVRFIYS